MYVSTILKHILNFSTTQKYIMNQNIAIRKNEIQVNSTYGKYSKITNIKK